MHSRSTSARFAAGARNALGAGVVGGLVGGVGMGIVLHAGSNMMPLVGALYGWPTVVGGWAAHLAHSVLIGVGFAILASRPALSRQTTDVGGCVAVGIAYAAAVGLVTGGLMLPVSLNAIGTRTLPEPLLPLPGALGGILVVISVGVAHVVYGVLLGATYGYVHGPTGVESEDRRIARG